MLPSPNKLCRATVIGALLTILSACTTSEIHPSFVRTRGTIPLGAAAGYVGEMVWPLPRSVHKPDSRFGRRVLRFHEGMDLVAPKGTPVRAAHAGTVLISGDPMRGYGLLVVLQGKGLLTVYAHLDEAYVEAGQKVRAGEQIGEVGNSGNANGSHLHFETRVDTPKGFAAVDPAVFFPRHSE